MKNSRKQQYRKRNYKSKKSNKNKRNTRKYTKRVKNIRKKQRKIKVRCKTKEGGGRPEKDKIDVNVKKDEDAIKKVKQYLMDLKEKIKDGTCMFNDYNVQIFLNEIIKKYNDGNVPVQLADFIIDSIKFVRNNDKEKLKISETNLITLKRIICNKKNKLQYLDVNDLFQKEINIKQIKSNSNVSF